MLLSSNKGGEKHAFVMRNPELLKHSLIITDVTKTTSLLAFKIMDASMFSYKKMSLYLFFMNLKRRGRGEGRGTCAGAG